MINVVLISFPAQATDNTAHLEFRFIAADKRIDLLLSPNGTVGITLTPLYPGPNGQKDLKTLSTQEQLADSSPLSKEIFDRVADLLQAKKQTEKRQAICKMLPSPEEAVYQLTWVAGNGDRTLLDGPHGCFLSEEMHYTHPRDRENVRLLGVGLRFMALAFLNKNELKK